MQITIEVDWRIFRSIKRRLLEQHGVEITDTVAFAKWVFEDTTFEAHEADCIIDGVLSYAYEDNDIGVRKRK